MLWAAPPAMAVALRPAGGGTIMPSPQLRTVPFERSASTWYGPDAMAVAVPTSAGVDSIQPHVTTEPFCLNATLW
jgi:hypothetical protein